jgi:hypothetical protein
MAPAISAPKRVNGLSSLKGRDTILNRSQIMKAQRTADIRIVSLNEERPNTCGSCRWTQNELGIFALRCELIRSDEEHDFGKVRSWDRCHLNPSRYKRASDLTTEASKLPKKELYFVHKKDLKRRAQVPALSCEQFIPVYTAGDIDG